MSENMHCSVWEKQSGEERFAALRGVRSADVVVIGAGITGLTAASLLHRQGKTVVVLEAGHVGAGTTGHSTAHLTTSYDYDYHDLNQSYGGETCRLLATGLREAVMLIEKNVKDQRIDCAFRRVPGYYVAESKADLHLVERERKVISELDLLPVEDMGDNPFPFPVTGGVRFPEQGVIDPLAYVRGLAERLGANVVFEHSRVTSVEEGSVTTEHGKVEAKNIIMATHTPLGISPLHVAVAPYRSYVMAVTLNSGHMPDALFWNTADPYSYLRLHEIDGEPVVIVGGSDRKTGHCGECEAFSDLEKYCRARFDVKEVKARWSAQFYEPVDHLPYIGPLPFHKNTFVGTGYSGDGMTLGTLAGWMISEQICGRETIYDATFKPSRINPQGAKDFVRETADIAKSYLTGRLPLFSKEAEISVLKQGEGGIFTVHGRRVAAFRDQQGDLKKFNAVCPHMGCTVQWNDAQKTFDCPCHGSRFDTEGGVLEGPALRALSPWESESGSKN